MRRAVVAIAFVLFVASCGDDGEPTLTPVSTAVTQDDTVTNSGADTDSDTDTGTNSGADQTEEPAPADPTPDGTDEAIEDDVPPEALLEPLTGNYSVEIITTLPHDSTAYTQGLELDGARLLETTGLYGLSQRRWIDTSTGEVTASVDLPEELFGEGATIVDGTILQLTWQAEILLVADGDSLVETGRGAYSGEGWGLCFDGALVVMSNGSSTLTFRDPDTFDVVRSVTVTDANGVPVEQLNELECVGDQVLANVWGLDSIAVIDPVSGALAAVIDASSLRPANAPADDLDYALNGIAHVAESDTYYLTGKWWDVLYEVRLVPG